MTVADHSIQISIDRGGTFTDVYASWTTTHRHEWTTKLLSRDPAYPDAPREGIRRVLQHVLGISIPPDQKLNTHKIDYIRLSTTVATNALLERRGAKHALLITKGFKDLLEIGNQSRPRIFDLAIQKPRPLYSRVIEVDERLGLLGFSADPQYHQRMPHFDPEGRVIKTYDNQPHPHLVVRGHSGEAVQIIKSPDLHLIRNQLLQLKEQGFQSLAVVLMHSYTYPEHEQQIGRIAKEIGFGHVSLSSELMPMIKLVSRGTSSTADAYLTPILREYMDGFFAGFDESLKGTEAAEGGRSTRVEFMRSDGGLADLHHFSGLHSILSGPAGGVVGYALTTFDPNNNIPVIGLDMGGTSTDVSRFDGRYETVFESTTAGITVQSPQLDINTVAAGGGSRLFWRNGLFVTGPESAGASPGPACYRKGGPLTVTDANLVLGRLIPEYFPKIFGPSKDQRLDREASISLFEELRQTINQDLGEELSLDEVAWGFIKIANETMCRPIRALTEARGYESGKHILSVFGGAGGQHGCAIAETLGIRRIVMHRHASILSAYGMALADRVIEAQQPSATVYAPDTRRELHLVLDRLQRQVSAQLAQQGFQKHRIVVERYLNLRYDGTDTALMVLDPSPNHLHHHHHQEALFDYLEAFKKAYLAQFGFLLAPDKAVICDDIRVRGLGKSRDEDEEKECSSISAEMGRLKYVEKAEEEVHNRSSVGEDQRVFFEGYGRTNTRMFQLSEFATGDQLVGPAVLLDLSNTIILHPAATASFLSNHIVIDLPS
ncbi:5-oxoprolinase (ATP-hydrolysing) [Puccinia sorghi]|uniref:5-oxoprolinase (ATP-hydrolysing) n=1 Tax=Puccinia sorghi TaxID=27349 RepID=A0A0L6UDC7_9BASI|nr:5-oxoprolinase (ATP-hydrolysing) [Puccinia sorghi]